MRGSCAGVCCRVLGALEMEQVIEKECEIAEGCDFAIQARGRSGSLGSEWNAEGAVCERVQGRV